jgi:hypothetical protein
VELVGDDDKASIKEVYDNALGCLSDSDQQLPQIKLFLPLLTAGIGVHHSGILPILRELVELLFQEGLIKVCTAQGWGFGDKVLRFCGVLIDLLLPSEIFMTLGARTRAHSQKQRTCTRLCAWDDT